MRKTAIVFICYVFTLCSCSKESIFSYYLKGEWTITQMDVFETTDTITSSYTLYNAGTYVFTKNNEGSVTTSSGSGTKTLTFKWTAQSNKKVTLYFEDQSSEEWTVLSDKPKTQIWENTIVTEKSSGGVSVTNTLYKKMYLKALD